MTIEVGSVLCGKYGLEASIGKGGMGEVFSATNLDNGHRVAIKVVTRSLVGDILVQRLHREAMAAARVRSEYVPQLLDVARDDDGELFLVMELLEGETLSERLRRVGGFLSWDEVKVMGEHILLGLIDAHAAGVVHRDLKPGNIFLATMLDGRERAKILDFGVCKLDSQDVEHLTTTGEALGTIAYMAPEQIRGASKVDERADLYSFAMVVFEALSGRLAHDASGQMAMIASKLERSARSLRDLAQVPTPAGLDALVGRALARKPVDRFASAGELLKAWRALGPPTVAPRVLPIFSGVGQVRETETVMTAVTRAVTPRSSKLGIVLAAASLFLASALLLFVLVGRPRAKAAVATTLPADTNAQNEANAQAAPPGAAATDPAAAPANDPSQAADPVVALDQIELTNARVDAGATASASPRPIRSWRPRPAPAATNKDVKKPAAPAGPHIQEKPVY